MAVEGLDQGYRAFEQRHDDRGVHVEGKRRRRGESEIRTLGPARHYSCPSRYIPVRPTGALEPFHSRLGRRPVSAYGLLASTILPHSAADQERDLD